MGHFLFLLYSWDGIEDVRRDGSVQPGDDTLIDLRPGVVHLHDLGVEGSIHVIEEAELAERDHEVGLPGGEGVVVEIKDDRNMVADGDGLDGGEGHRGRRKGVAAAAARHGGGRGGHRWGRKRLEVL